MTCGIYMIKNLITNQLYIGQSVNIERRWGEHCNLKDMRYSYIERAIKKLEQRVKKKVYIGRSYYENVN